MQIFKDKKMRTAGTLTSDRAAAAIANGIVHLQKRLATTINLWFNGFSKKQQKWIAGLVAVALTTWLLIIISRPSNAFSKQSKVPYGAIHIGQPSDLPTPLHGQRELNDSLTNK